MTARRYGVRCKNKKEAITMMWGQLKSAAKRMLRQDVVSVVFRVVGEIEEFADELASVDPKMALAVASALEAVARRIRHRYRQQKSARKYALYGEGE
jgi:translation initiation factor IF-1